MANSQDNPPPVEHAPTSAQGRVSLLLFGVSLALFAASGLMFYLAKPPERRTEAFHRGFTPLTRDWTPENCWVPDPEVEHNLAPGADFTAPNDQGVLVRYQAVPVGQGGVCFRDNGIRGPVFAVAVGDSFTFGHGVALEDCWVARLEAAANADVVNLGVSNIFGSTQYLRTLTRHGLPLHPKVVVWATFVNDWLDDTLFNAWYELSRTLGRQIEFPRSRPIYDAIRGNAYVLPDEPGTFPPLDQKQSYASDGLRFTFDATAYAVQDLRFAAVSAGRASSEKALLEAKSAALAGGAAFVVVVIPAKEHVYHRRVTQVVEYARTQDPAVYCNATTAFCRERGIPCLDLLPVLTERADRGEQLYFAEDGHFNVAGNRVAAEAIERFLKEHGLMP